MDSAYPTTLEVNKNSRTDWPKHPDTNGCDTIRYVTLAGFFCSGTESVRERFIFTFTWLLPRQQLLRCD